MNVAVLLVEPAAFAAALAVLRVPVPQLRRASPPALVVVAVLSAAGAVAAGGAPTGWAALDIVLAAALGAAAVAAGLAASTRLMLAAAVVAAVAGIGSLALPLALAAIGLLLASLLIEVEPLLDATAAALVVQAALRLTSPGGTGLTALVAAAIVVALLASAGRTMDRRQRRTTVRVLAATGGFLVAGALLGAAASLTAVEPLRRGLAVATTVDAAGALDEPDTQARLEGAGREFAKARRSLDAWWARPVAAVPVAAQHWRVLRAAAVTGDELVAAGRRALDAPALDDVRVAGGRVPLQQLAAAEPAVADVAARATAARRRLDAARSAWLLPALATELHDNLARVREIERTTQLVNRALPLVPALVGGEGPRRYFLALQTPVEARGGGGFMGNFGEVEAVDGRISLVRLGRQDDLTLHPGRFDRRLDAPADFLDRYARFRPDQHWGNVNLSPDFPTTAGVITNLYPQSGGAPVDGVIAVDPAGLAALLRLTGPVQVPSWPGPITADNATQILYYDHYEHFPASREEERVDFLGAVAQEAWSRLTTGDLPPLPHLVAALGPAVRDKHLFLASVHPEEQRLFEAMGAAGRVAPVRGDFVGLVTQNAGGNKIDYFLHREIDYRVQLDPGRDRLTASATVSLRNDAPAQGIAPAFIGNELLPPLPSGTNKLYLSFYTPWQLVEGRVDGNPVEFEQATELGRRVYSATLLIPPRSTAVVELTLAGRLGGDRYRLDLHRQPMVNPDRVTASVAVPAGWRTAAGGRQHTTELELTGDATVEVALRRR